MPKTIEECRAAYGRVWETTIDGVATFVFRKPTSHEWAHYDAMRVALGVATGGGNLTKEIMLDFLKECEDLSRVVVVSHTGDELGALDDEFLGIFRDLAQNISGAVDELRAKSGKGSPPPGPGSAAAKSPSA